MAADPESLGQRAHGRRAEALARRRDRRPRRRTSSTRQPLPRPAPGSPPPAGLVPPQQRQRRVRVGGHGPILTTPYGVRNKCYIPAFILRTTYENWREMTTTPPPTLLARGLRKRYGDTAALDGFDLEVAAGTVHALLGPNGAGKSTAVGLRHPDPVRRGRGPRRRRRRPPGGGRGPAPAIGLVGQAAALDEVLRGRENLVHVRPAARPVQGGGERARRRAARDLRPRPRRPTARSRRTPAACAGGSTSPPA